MTKPPDWAIACAFIQKALEYQQLNRLGQQVPSALSFIDAVTSEAGMAADESEGEEE